MGNARQARRSNISQRSGRSLCKYPGKGRGGVDVASRMLRSALVRQLAIIPPEIAGDYREILDESGVMPDPKMVRDCQSSYTSAQQLRFQQRLNYINDIQE